MKIAIVAPGYAPTIGGVEMVVTCVAEHLVAMGVAVEVWAQQRDTPTVTTEHRNGVVIRRFPASSSVRFSLSPALWNHTRRFGPRFDLLHAHGYHSTASLGSVLSARMPPLVLSPHYHGTGHSALAKAAHVPYRFVGARLIRTARRIIAVSQAETTLLERDFALRTNQGPCVIHNAVDTKLLQAAEPWPSQVPTAVVLGRLEEYKNVDTVLAAFDGLERSAQLVIIGDGPDRARLAGLASNHRHPDRVRFLGRLSDSDVRRWLRTARVVVSLSRNEAFGLVGLEAVAAGGVALLSDIPAHREVAQLLPPGRVELAAVERSALRAQLANLLMTPTGRPVAVRDWSQAAAEYADLYRTVLA